MKIEISKGKILKLSNTLIYKVPSEAIANIDADVNRMENYVKIKGAALVGPLVQYTKAEIDEEGKIDVQLSMIRQCNNFIHNVEAPYTMESILRVKNCMYVRYIGPEDKLKFAYDKINVTAFEEDIELRGDSYTIFVDRNEEEDTIVADVFMPRADAEE